MTELIRQIVARYREQQDPPARRQEAYMKIVGLGASGKDDVAERHDVYLGEVPKRDRPR